MAIQMRRGAYADFDPTKMVPGEFAVVQEDDPNTDSGEAVYMCYSAGSVGRLASADEVSSASALSFSDSGGDGNIVISSANE